MPCPGDEIYVFASIHNGSVTETKEAVLSIETGEYVSFCGKSFEAHVLIETVEEEAVTLEFLAIHPCTTRYDGKVQRLRREERFGYSFTHTDEDGAVEKITFLAVYETNSERRYHGRIVSPCGEF